MINGISGSSDNWQNIIVSTSGEQVAAEKPQVGAKTVAKTAASDVIVDVDNYDLSGQSQSQVLDATIATMTLPDKVPSGGIGGFIAGIFGYDVSILKEGNDSLPTTPGQMKSWASELGLSYSQQKEAGRAFSKVQSDPVAVSGLLSLMQKETFVDGKSSLQDTILALVQDYPSALSLTNLSKLQDLDWYKAMSSDDKERACRVIAMLSTEVGKADVSGDNVYLYGSLDQIMAGEIKLTFEDTDFFANKTKDCQSVIIGRHYVPSGHKSMNDKTKRNLNLAVLQELPKEVYNAGVMGKVPGTKETVEALRTLGGNSGFTELSKENKLAYIGVVQACKGESVKVRAMGDLISGSGFQKQDAAVKGDIIGTLGLVSSDKVVAHFSDLLSTAWFGKLERTDKNTAARLFINIANEAANTTEPERLITLDNALRLLKDGEMGLAFTTEAGQTVSASDNVVTVSTAGAENVSDLAYVVAGAVVEQSTKVSLPDPATLEELKASSGFKALKADLQKSVLTIINNHSDSARTTGALLGIINSTAFQQAGANQSVILKAAADGDLVGLGNLSKLMGNLGGVPAGESKLVYDAIGASKDLSGMAKQLDNLLTGKTFAKLSGETRIAMLSQCKHFPNANSVKHLGQLSEVAWFGKLSLEDQQRAAKSIAYMGEVANDSNVSQQKTIINNTMNRLLSGQIDLNFVDMDDDPGTITYGYAYPNRPSIYINKALVPAGNDAYPKKDIRAKHAVLGTIPHEVNHKANGDVNQATYRYFQAEYRAWYVAWIAEYGRVPTRQEALDRCVNIINLYSNINKALFECGAHTQNYIKFLSQVMGQELSATTEDEIMAIFSKKVVDPKLAAPEPDPTLNPDNDN